MGKSNTIAQQQKSNEEFNKYITKMTEDLDKRKDTLEQQLDKMQEKHYVDFDKSLLIEGKYHHLTTLSEWSLDSINEIINACSKAIFGSHEPQGSTKKETSDEIKASIEAIKQRELYIANAAFDIIQSIVGTFKNSTQTGLEQSLEGKPIAPGMTMFIGVENNTFSVSQFFKNEVIIQTMFVFKVFYSLKEGLKQSQLSDLELYEDQKITFRNQIEDLNKAIASLDVMAANYESELIRFSNIAEIANEKMNNITEMIKKLTVAKLDEEKASCNNIIRNIRESRKYLKSANKVYELESKPFTYKGNRDEAIDYIRRWTPAYVHLKFLKATNYSGNHFIAIFESRHDNITQSDVNGWVLKGLRGKGNFKFD